MAARTLRPKHTDEIRNKIRASQLVNRLENHVFGEVEMNSTQVTAALGLLKKCVPDIQAIQHSGDEQNPIQHVFGWKQSKS
jgi:hypothetical protein